jgi:probable HAF family extracellular repeat protein
MKAYLKTTLVALFLLLVLSVQLAAQHHHYKLIDMETLGGAFGGAQAINNSGQIVGVSSIAADPGACNGFPDNGDFNCHNFLWEKGALIDLNTTTLGGTPLFVAEIDDAGEIIGAAAFPNAPFDAFLWRDGVATDLGNLNGCASAAHAINAKGQVVGPTFSCDGTDVRAFLWEHGSMVDLNTLIPSDSSLELANASDINDRGEINGIGVPLGVPIENYFFEGHGFLLIPCDENHPDVEGCDYSLVEASAIASAKPQPTAQRLATANPGLSLGAINRLMRSAGFRSMPWYRGFGGQRSK